MEIVYIQRNGTGIYYLNIFLVFYMNMLLILINFVSCFNLLMMVIINYT